MFLLHAAGDEVQAIFVTLADTGATYDEAVAALNAHFQPQVNVTFQRHVSAASVRKLTKRSRSSWPESENYHSIVSSVLRPMLSSVIR